MSALRDLLTELDHDWMERHHEAPVVSWSYSSAHSPPWSCRVALPADGSGARMRRVFRGESGEQALRRLVEHLRALA